MLSAEIHELEIFFCHRPLITPSPAALQLQYIHVLAYVGGCSYSQYLVVVYLRHMYGRPQRPGRLSILPGDHARVYPSMEIFFSVAAALRAVFLLFVWRTKQPSRDANQYSKSHNQQPCALPSPSRCILLVPMVMGDQGDLGIIRQVLAPLRPLPHATACTLARYWIDGTNL
ncbi:hypothetical protein J3F83DRAFT_726445 [Trichoderma novae-zelandiae]